MNARAILDIGKTNAKLFILARDGTMLDQSSTANRVIEGPPYRHHDLAGLEDWFLDGLTRAAARFEIDTIIPCAHGGSGVLVDPDGPRMPMIDYEQPIPPALDAAYRAEADPFRERGSGVLLGAAHAARQLLWFERDWPHALAAASAWLNTPQYWAWRFSGVLATEVTSAAAQSHLWSTLDRSPSGIAGRHGWTRLLPPMTPAWTRLGSIRPELAARTGLSSNTAVLCGIHDSSANFYRYQQAGLSDFTVISTGTWIVALTDRTNHDFDRERPGHACNADVMGNPVPGMLTMGGREFSAVAGDAPGPGNLRTLRDIIESDTFALPFFAGDDGLFPGRADRGRLTGPFADDPAARFTLALLYSALLTSEIIDTIPARTILLDGTFVRDPMYPALIQALHPDARVRVNHDTLGVVAGAALLADHETRARPAPLDLAIPDTGGIPDLSSYRARWRDRVRTLETPT